MIFNNNIIITQTYFLLKPISILICFMDFYLSSTHYKCLKGFTGILWGN